MFGYASLQCEQHAHRSIGNVFGAILGVVEKRDTLLRKRIEIDLVVTDAVTHQNEAFWQFLGNGFVNKRRPAISSRNRS